MKGFNVRWKLTLWYGAVLTLIVAAYGMCVAIMMNHHLLARTDFELDEELTELALEVRLAKDDADLKQQLQHRFFQHATFLFQVGPLGGNPLFRSEALGEMTLPIPQEEISGPHLTTVSEIHPLPTIGEARIATRTAHGPDGIYLVQAAASLSPNFEELRAVIWILLTAGPLAIAAAVIGGYWLARHALAPVERMATTAEQITGTQLQSRIDVTNPHDELGHLARTFNSMLDRLQRAVEEMRRFTADAAHELRTPLAVLQAETEIALRMDRTAEEYRQVLQITLSQSKRLGRLADRLLTLCRHDSGLAQQYREEVPFDALLLDVIDQIRVKAEEKGVSLEASPLEECTVFGDDVQLCQLLFNILDNAIKYTPAGGRVTVQGELREGDCVLAVSDTGIGIPAADLPLILDRFYRVDKSRNGETGGTGLGLAISKAVVEGHGGSISIRSVAGAGTTVEIRLPCVISIPAGIRD